MIVNALLFVVTASTINLLTGLLSPVALFVILIYSYCKRFTALAHLVLGLGLGIAPVGAYIAVTGHFAWPPCILALLVMTWCGGFDIIYALLTITVPYTVSLNNAEVEFKYTTSATIIPNPKTVTDWDNERTFRVTSYNGDAREYAYKVVKSEIESDGDVELKTTEEVASFAATKTTVVKGNLIIGSDAEEAEKITDISALASLKEVTGNIVIRNSYNGADLTGLDNIVSAGGLQLGSVDVASKATELHMISMKALEMLSGDISVYNDQVTYVLFEKLATIEGSVMFNAPSLQSFEFPVLTTVGQDLNIQGLNEENKAAGTIASLELSELTSVGGVLSVNNLAKLTSMSFLKLKETGGFDFHTVPVMLETINLPEVETVNGSIIMEANMETPPTGSFVPQRNDVLQAFGGMDKLTTVKGQIKIKNFTALKQLPDWSKITTLGSITLDYLDKSVKQVKIKTEWNRY